MPDEPRTFVDDISAFTRVAIELAHACEVEDAYTGLESCLVCGHRESPPDHLGSHPLEHADDCPVRAVLAHLGVAEGPHPSPVAGDTAPPACGPYSASDIPPLYEELQRAHRAEAECTDMVRLGNQAYNAVSAAEHAYIMAIVGAYECGNLVPRDDTAKYAVDDWEDDVRAQGGPTAFHKKRD